MAGNSSHAVVARRVRIALGAFVFVLVLAMFPLASDPTADIKILLYHWAAFGCITYWLSQSWRHGIPQKRPRFSLPLLLLWLGWGAVSAAFSNYPWHSLVEWSKWLSLALLYYAAAQVYSTPQQVHRLMLSGCVAVAVSSVYALCQKAGWDFFPWDPAFIESDAYRELPGTFGNPNLAAHTLVLCTIMAIYLCRQPRMRWAALFVPLYLSHHYLTGQRGGMIALGGASLLVAVTYLFHRRSSLAPAGRALASVLISAAIAVGVGAGAMGYLKVRTGTPYPLDLALLVRYASHASGSEMILDRPLLGHGPGNYRIANPPFWTEYEQRWFAERRLSNANAHQDALESGAELGFPGLLLYLAFFTVGAMAALVHAFAAKTLSQRRTGLAYAALFCAFLVDGLFGFNLRTPVSAVMLFLIIGTLDSLLASGPTAPLSGWRKACAAAVVVAAVLNVGLGTRVFASSLMLQRGQGAVHWQAYAAADRVFLAGERLAPWDWRFAYERGMLAFRRNDPEAAIPHFGRALARNPNYIPARIAVARAHFNLAAEQVGVEQETADAAAKGDEHLAQATFHAQRGLILCPYLPEGEDLLGHVAFLRALHYQRYATGNTKAARARDVELQQAVAHLEGALELGAENQGEVRRLLAQAYAGLGQDELAEATLVMAIQADATDTESWAPLFALCARRNRLPFMLELIQRQRARLAERAAPAPEAVAALQRWQVEAEKALASDGTVGSD